MAAKRRAHYLSRFFMAGFTPSGNRDDLLWVTSKTQQRRWRQKAEDVAHQRDLFRPVGTDLDPDQLEDAFGAVENKIAPVLRHTLNSGRLPADPRQMNLLLHVVALNAARPPAAINELEARLDENIRELSLKLMSTETYDKVVRDFSASGRRVPTPEEWERLKAALRQGDLKAVVHRNILLIKGVLGRAAVLVELLARRNWIMLRAPTETEFVCSDQPVNLLNNRNPPPGISEKDARFDEPLWDVVMPLSREYCLVGHFGCGSGTADARKGTVAFINTITVQGATDYIFHASEFWIADDGDEESHCFASDLRPFRAEFVADDDGITPSQAQEKYTH